MKLQPVSFRYKQPSEDGRRPLQYGLIAEDVAKVYPDLVQYDTSGKPYAVYYHLLTPMLLNELQRLHRQAAVQASRIAALTRENAVRRSDIAELRAEDDHRMAVMRQENDALKSQLASVKLAQERQAAALAKLAAFVQASRQGSGVRPAGFSAP
jgi:hypothetical protein